jgi:hypothetical protein
LPTDDKQAHKSTSPAEPFTASALANLRAWYARDYAFLACCEHFSEAPLATS